MSGFDVAFLAALGVPLIGIGAWWENEKRKKEIEEISRNLRTAQEKLSAHEKRIAGFREFMRKQREELT